MNIISNEIIQKVLKIIGLSGLVVIFLVACIKLFLGQKVLSLKLTQFNSNNSYRIVRVFIISLAMFIILGLLLVVYTNYNKKAELKPDVITKANMLIVTKNNKYMNLSKLKLGINIELIDSIFGIPTKKEPYGEYMLRVYVDADFFLEIISDSKTNLVVKYTVTIRNKDFNPNLTYGENTEVLTLGKSTFLKLFHQKEENTPDKIMAWAGAKCYYYTESYYLANQGNNNYCIVGISPLGARFPNDEEPEYRELLHLIVKHQDFIFNLDDLDNSLETADVRNSINEEDKEALNNLRKKIIPNSFGMVNNPELINSSIGPDYFSFR